MEDNPLSEFVEDLRTRLIDGLTHQLGISSETAGMVVSSMIVDLCKDYRGDRPYIGPPKEAQQQRERRNHALLRDWQNGERIPLLARRYQLSTKRVYALLKISRAPT